MTKLFLSLLVLLLFACASPTKMLEKGQNDRAFKYYAKQVSSKKVKPTTTDVQGLEQSFERANQLDLALADSLRRNGEESGWPAINALFRKIKARQATVQPLLPVRSKDGYVAQFLLLGNIDSLESDSRELAAQYLYNMAEYTLERARTENRLLARQAYAYLTDLKKNYFSDWRDIELLLGEAVELGTTHFLVQTENMAVYGNQFFAPIRSYGALANRAVFWQTFDFQEQPGQQYDYVVSLQLNNVYVGFENRTESTTSFSKDIEVRVHVVKDSSGQVIERTPVYERIWASMTEVRITREAMASLIVRVTDLQTGGEVAWDNFQENTYFDQNWITVSGDDRAVDNKPFCTGFGFPMGPSEWSMVEDLSSTLRGRLNRFWRAYGEQF